MTDYYDHKQGDNAFLLKNGVLIILLENNIDVGNGIGGSREGE